MSAKKLSTGAKATIVVVFTVMFMLVFAELGLRSLQALGIGEKTFALLGQARPPMDTKDGAGMYYMHPYNAYRLKPGYERGITERINSLGFRGEEIEKDKPEDTYRIVVMGGSTTFAVYLPWNESAPYFMQEDLRNRFQTDNIEVINGGLTGSTTAETLHRLLSQVLEIDPDMVVIYHGYNDLFPRVFDNYESDYYHFRNSDPTNPPGLTRFMLYRLFLRVFSPSAFHENYNLANKVWRTGNLPPTDTQRTLNYLSSDASAFELNLEAAIQVLQARGIQPVLASFAINPDVWHWNDYIPMYLWELGIAEHNEVISELAERHNVPLVPFLESTMGWPGLFNDSIHMTNYGNKYKAMVFDDTIVPYVEEALGSKAGIGERVDPKAPYETTRLYKRFGNKFRPKDEPPAEKAAAPAESSAE